MSLIRPVGIDLGTTNSVVSYASDAGDQFHTETVLVDGDRRSMPSVVYFGPEQTYVGRKALNLLGQNPEYLARSTKRYLGEGDKYRFPPATEQFSPVGVASEILGTLAHDASDSLCEKVAEAVITVPADFSDAQRRLTRQAAEIAGLSVVSLIAEPTAAALAYDLREENETTVFVFDLGGGTFDASIIDINTGLYQVNATRGDNELGGDDWTDAIVAYLKESIEREYNVSIPSKAEDPLVNGRLWLAAEQMKTDLSSASSASTTLQYLDIGEETLPVVEVTLSREEFEWRTEVLRDQLLDHLDELFDGCSFEPSDIEEVLLVGGSTRLPQIQALTEQYFELQPKRAKNPDEAVATGAAIQAAIIASQPALDSGSSAETNLPTTIKTGDGELSLTETTLIDATTRSLGVDSRDPATGTLKYVEIIPNNTSIPAEQENDTFRPFKADEGCVGASGVRFKVYETAETDPTPDFREKRKMGEISIGDLDTSVPIDDQRITVYFRFDADNLLSVSVEEHTSGSTATGEFEPDLGHDRDLLAAEREKLPRVYE